MTSPEFTLASLPYQLDSSDLMTCLTTLPAPFFLDSAMQQGKAGRYDILSARPRTSISIDELFWNDKHNSLSKNSNSIFCQIENLLESIPVTELDSKTLNDLPFTGGVMGFLGYPEMTSAEGNTRVECGFIGWYDWCIIVDHHKQVTTLCFRPECSDETRQLVHIALSRQPRNEVDFRLLSPFSADLSRQQYQQGFDIIKEYIQAGDCYQVNLTQRFSSTYSGSPWGAYLRLRQNNGKPFSAFLAWGDKALISLSPERFLRVRDGQVLTQPIKGTRPRHSDPQVDAQLANDLTSSVKDRAENLMIVDLLRNDLGTQCRYGSIEVASLFELQSFDNVHHLVSSIQGCLRKDSTPLKLLESCFPGGSITGAPKVRAMEIIQEVEPFQRKAYCGTVFYLDQRGSMDSNITIRTLLCEGNEVYGWGGGGIVADSEAEDEYQETLDKIQPLFDSLL